jgi:hypothetical protein
MRGGHNYSTPVRKGKAHRRARLVRAHSIDNSTEPSR